MQNKNQKNGAQNNTETTPKTTGEGRTEKDDCHGNGCGKNRKRKSLVLKNGSLTFGNKKRATSCRPFDKIKAYQLASI